MYSASHVAVDKGLGFDFSDIAGLVKTALPVGLNIFSQQLQLKQIQATQKANVVGGYVQQSPGVYGQAYGNLPLSQIMQPQVQFGQPGGIPGQYYPPSSGMDMTTMVMIGGAVLVVGILAFKAFK